MRFFQTSGTVLFFRVTAGLAVVVGLHAQTSLPSAGGKLSPADPSHEAVIRATSNEVLVDVVVRNKKGHAVRDLTASDFHVFEDGEAQKITGFRLAETGSGTGNDGLREAKPGEARTQKESSIAAGFDPLRQIRLITLVFDRLGIDGRRLSREAAINLVDEEKDPNVAFAVMAVDQRLNILQQFTGIHARVKRAVELATSGTPAQFANQSDTIRAALAQSAAGGANADQMAASAGASTSPSGIGSAEADEKAAEMLQNMLTLSETLSRTQQGRASIFAMFAIVSQQETLPGRKNVMYFAEGFQVPPDLVEQFHSMISAANRVNVSVYAVDARGLLTVGQNQLNTEALAQAAGASKSQWANATKASNPVTPEQAKALDTADSALRAGAQNTLAELAESTGGFLIANSNDLRVPVRRMLEDLESHYEITYSPRLEQYDGKFRKITVSLDRTDLKIQTRSGYFALPPGSGDTLAPYEVALLHALSANQPPKAFPHRAGAFLFQSEASGTHCVFEMEVALDQFTIEENKQTGTYQMKAATLLLVRNAQGEVVEKISRDVPYAGPLEKVATFKNGNLLSTGSKVLAPGRYTLETVVMDKQERNATARNGFRSRPAQPETKCA